MRNMMSKELKFRGVGDGMAINLMPKDMVHCSIDLRCENEMRGGGEENAREKCGRGEQHVVEHIPGGVHLLHT